METAMAEAPINLRRPRNELRTTAKKMRFPMHLKMLLLPARRRKNQLQQPHLLQQHQGKQHLVLRLLVRIFYILLNTFIIYMHNAHTYLNLLNWVCIERCIVIRENLFDILLPDNVRFHWSFGTFV